jgi:hypothetical protein
MRLYRFLGLGLTVLLTACGQTGFGQFSLVPWNARLETSPSSGITTCWAANGEANIIRIDDAIPYFYPGNPHGLYPGSLVYATIEGETFSGKEEIRIGPRFRAALLSGKTMQFSYAPWPSGVSIERSTSLRGIERARACLGN